MAASARITYASTEVLSIGDIDPFEACRHVCVTEHITYKYGLATDLPQQSPTYTVYTEDILMTFPPMKVIYKRNFKTAANRTYSQRHHLTKIFILC